MITLDSLEVRAGGRLQGSASWEKPARGAERLTLWLVWRTDVRLDKVSISDGSVRADGDYCVVERKTLEAGDAPVRFEFAIPKEGPLTYDGRMLRVIWELLAGTQAGASVKVTERAEFNVSARPAP